MDAARLMITDHQVLAELFRKVEGVPAEEVAGTDHGPAGQDGALSQEEAFEQLANRLHAHLVIADDLLLPALRRRMPKQDVEKVRKADDDLDRYRALVDQVEHIDPATPGFTDEIHRLREDFTRHVEAEESLVIPRTEDLLSDDELIKLGERMENRRDRFLRRSTLSLKSVHLPHIEQDPLMRRLKVVGIIVALGVALSVMGRIKKATRPRTGPARPRRRR